LNRSAALKKLDVSEKALLTDYEKGELQSISPSKADRIKFKAAATSTFIKDRRINIRLTEKLPNLAPRASARASKPRSA